MGRRCFGDRRAAGPEDSVPTGGGADRRKGSTSVDYVDPRTTCSTAGVPRLALQDPSQILQPPTDDHVLWLHEDHHQFRAIAMDQRPPVGRDVTTWNGLSRGRWDGNTLVDRDGQFQRLHRLDDSGNFYTNNARVTERLTMVDPTPSITRQPSRTRLSTPGRGRWRGHWYATPPGIRAVRRSVPRRRPRPADRPRSGLQVLFRGPCGNAATRHASVCGPSFDVLGSPGNGEGQGVRRVLENVNGRKANEVNDDIPGRWSPRGRNSSWLAVKVDRASSRLRHRTALHDAAVYTVPMACRTWKISS